MVIINIPLIEINDPLFQPRDTLESAGIEALANSIQELGLLNPVLVQRTEQGYRLVAGTRRYHAFKMLGREEIPAKIIEEGDREATLIQFSENFHRQDLNPIQFANMLKFLLEEMHLSTIEISQLCNKSRDWVSRTLGLLEMPDYMVQAVETGQMSPSVAQELRVIPDETLRESYAAYAVTGGCTEKQARQWKQQSIATIAARDARLAAQKASPPRGEEPPPPPPPENTCHLCGAPETSVVLESLPICWHCKRNLVTLKAPLKNAP